MQRDEFFWTSTINKATIVVNAAEASFQTKLHGRPRAASLVLKPRPKRIRRCA